MTGESDTTPAAVVRRQVEAYNRGDLDAFVACFDEGARLAPLDGGEVVAGHAGIREKYGDLFAQFPDLDCEVVAEFAVGEYVALHERITGTPEPREALAVYRVREGLIDRLWLGEP